MTTRVLNAMARELPAKWPSMNRVLLPASFSLPTGTRTPSTAPDNKFAARVVSSERKSGLEVFEWQNLLADCQDGPYALWQSDGTHMAHMPDDLVGSRLSAPPCDVEYFQSLATNRHVLEEGSMCLTFSSPDREDEPNRKFIETVHLLRSELPAFLTPTKSDVTRNLYASDIKLIDRTTPITVQGYNMYCITLAAFAAGANLYFRDPVFDVLWFKREIESRTVICRWRVCGTPRMPSSIYGDVYYDRLSTLYIDSDGIIREHHIDKVDTIGKEEEDRIKQNRLMWDGIH